MVCIAYRRTFCKDQSWNLAISMYCHPSVWNCLIAHQWPITTRYLHGLVFSNHRSESPRTRILGFVPFFEWVSSGNLLLLGPSSIGWCFPMYVWVSIEVYKKWYFHCETSQVHVWLMSGHFVAAFSCTCCHLGQYGHWSCMPCLRCLSLVSH